MKGKPANPPDAAKSRYFRPSKVTGRYGRFDDILLGVANGSLFSSLQHSADGLFPKVAGAFFWNSRDLHGGPVAGRPAGGPDVAVGCRPTATRTLGCDRFETAANYAFSLAKNFYFRCLSNGGLRMDRELLPMLEVGAEGESVGIVLDLDPPPRPVTDQAWRWTLRLALPALVFLSGLALYWIWFDRVFETTSWDTVVVGLPLAAEATAAAIWSVGVWCAKDLV